jgi:hypothetical protein
MLDVTEVLRDSLQPTPNLDHILDVLMDNCGCETLEELLRKVVKFIGNPNPSTKDAIIAHMCETCYRTGVLPRELLNEYERLQFKAA